MSQGQRLKNVLGGSAGSFVEWFDWFAYASFALYFSRAFFPAGDQTAQLLNAAFVFAGGFLATAARCAAARHLRRPRRPSRRAHAVGRHDVRRVIVDRADSDRPRLGVSPAADPGAIAAGPVSRRRVRRIGHLCQRDGGTAAPRLLVGLPVRDDHRRPAGRDAAAGAVAATAHRGPAVRVGLARAVRRRRGNGCRRVLDPPQPPRDRLIRPRLGRAPRSRPGAVRCSRSTRARRPSCWC